ncbi:DEAD/DEAH box helicase [Thermoleophilia bacterium SCSIO 60948]|nr:DEAD/DEAH box helicase [Thermoleophilia bacterium SCSIO 60948]
MTDTTTAADAPPADAPIPKFSELGLKPPIAEALDELGFDEPTPIQAQAIPELLKGHDVIGQAQTGTGKTAAFGLPLLQYLDPDSDETQAIVLTPTRELCIQVTQAIRSYAEHLDIEVVAVFGGAPIATQQSQLRRGAHVVVATVGRMKDLISRRSLVLTSARYVVLDEADEMLDLGFIEDVERILRMCPSGRQTLLFSATMPPPIARLAEQYMYDPVTVKITPKKLTVDAIAQAYVEVSARDKTEKLIEVLKAEEPEQAIIFCRTKIGCARLDKTLRDRGLRCKALHGDMSQGQRDGVMISFKGHKLTLLVATDVAARGLDIEHVTHVINYDLPNNSEIYVHRIGRTGRVGRTGRAITFVTPSQREDLDRYEREVHTTIDEWEPPEERIEHAPKARRRARRGAAIPREKLVDSASPAEATGPEPESAATPAELTDALETEQPEAPPASPESVGVPELDAEPKTTEPEAAAEPTDATADETAMDDEEVTKLFLNRGRRSGLEEEDVRWALVEGAVVPDEAIESIRVLERFSFVELESEAARLALERLDGTKIKGRQVRMEYAKD